MKIRTIVCISLALICSCKILPDSSRNSPNDKNVYKLKLNPGKGARYYYDINNNAQVKMEVSGKNIENVNRSQTGVFYELKKDSADNLLLDLTYDKVHIYSKNQDEVIEMDAANAETSDDPMEKMLGALTTTHIHATMTPTGEVRSVTGYKEVADKIIESVNNRDASAQLMIRRRLEQTIGNGLIRGNMDQLFRIFPDSAVHIGDKWKLSSDQPGPIKLNTKGSFILENIEDGIARITSKGDMSSDSASSNIQGYDVTTNLKGTQEGEYQMDVHTGMLVSARITASVEGTLDMIGRQIPVTVEMKIDMKGQKVK